MRIAFTIDNSVPALTVSSIQYVWDVTLLRFIVKHGILLHIDTVIHCVLCCNDGEGGRHDTLEVLVLWVIPIPKRLLYAGCLTLVDTNV